MSSEDERLGVDPITETKQARYLGSMKPFSGLVSQDGTLGILLGGQEHTATHCKDTIFPHLSGEGC